MVEKKNVVIARKTLRRILHESKKLTRICNEFQDLYLAVN